LHKRLFSVVLATALVGGLLALAAAPAQAARPFNVQQFLPGDQAYGPCAAGECLGDVLSDKFDGTDSLAHLTVVATPETDSVTWYACPTSVTAPVSNTELGQCTITIGTDTTGVIPPIGPGASSPADEAYDVNWDIPGSLDQQKRDILALACIGAGQELDTNPNCRDSLEENIFLEDAQTGVAANQTTSGEAIKYRTNQPCQGQPTSNTTCEATFKAFTHGSAVPNTGFEVRATTSDDVTNLRTFVNSPADAQQEPAAANFVIEIGCTLLSTSTNFKTWSCVWTMGKIR